MKIYSTDQAGGIPQEPRRTYSPACYTDQIPARALNIAGYRAPYYKLILNSGRSLEEFKTMCDSSDVHQQASKLLSVPQTFEGTAERDKVRTLVSSAIIAIISK